MTLVIADKNYSLWPLSAWLCLKTAKLPFREVLIRFGQPDTREQMLRYSPTGRVPLLRHGALAIWDSLAICEYVAELKPEAELWPAARDARLCPGHQRAAAHRPGPAGRPGPREHRPPDRPVALVPRKPRHRRPLPFWPLHHRRCHDRPSGQPLRDLRYRAAGGCPGLLRGPARAPVWWNRNSRFDRPPQPSPPEAWPGADLIGD
jgi:hypothetical protein